MYAFLQPWYFRRRDDSNDHVPRIVSESTNIYRTVDRPPEQWPNPHESGRVYKYRKRYSFKTRSRVVDHPAPERMTRYKWKAWSKKPETPITDEKPPKPKAPPANERDVTLMDKKELVKGMQWEHPLRTLSVGTLNANIKQVLSNNSTLRYNVRTSIQQVVRLASETKRICQRAIAQYIERVVDIKMDPKDIELLDMICPRIQPKVKDKDQDNEADELEELDHQIEEKQDRQASFLTSLMHCIYNKARPSRTKPTAMDVKVTEFIARASDFLPAMTGGYVPYPASAILRSATGQMCVEIKKHYRNGSYDLCEKVQAYP